MKNPCSADDLVENFNLKILKVIDVIAPDKVKTISGKQHFIFTMISIKRASMPAI